MEQAVTPKNYLTHPRNAHLITLPSDRQRRSPMMRRICIVLFALPGLTREEIMAHANPRGKVTSNRCYFRRIHAGYGGRYHDEATYSVIINGLVRVAGKTKTGRLTYELTDAGREFAQRR